MGTDGRFPSPGVDLRFDPPATDWEHSDPPNDRRFLVQGNVDTRFDNDGAGYGPAAADPDEPPRVIPAQRFIVKLPLVADQFIGAVLATRDPTAFALPLGNANQWWAIDNAGIVTVTAKGASELLVPDWHGPNATATNAHGTSPPEPILISLMA